MFAMRRHLFCINLILLLMLSCLVAWKDSDSVIPAGAESVTTTTPGVLHTSHSLEIHMEDSMPFSVPEYAKVSFRVRFTQALSFIAIFFISFLLWQNKKARNRLICHIQPKKKDYRITYMHAKDGEK